jgi:hypothetical protein
VRGTKRNGSLLQAWRRGIIQSMMQCTDRTEMRSRAKFGVLLAMSFFVSYCVLAEAGIAVETPLPAVKPVVRGVTSPRDLPEDRSSPVGLLLTASFHPTNSGQPIPHLQTAEFRFGGGVRLNRSANVLLCHCGRSEVGRGSLGLVDSISGQRSRHRLTVSVGGQRGTMVRLLLNRDGTPLPAMYVSYGRKLRLSWDVADAFGPHAEPSSLHLNLSSDHRDLFVGRCPQVGRLEMQFSGEFELDETRETFIAGSSAEC